MRGSPLQQYLYSVRYREFIIWLQMQYIFADLAPIYKLRLQFLWDVTPCSLVDIYQIFEEHICFHLQRKK
jgi:hypothetical protein